MLKSGGVTQHKMKANDVISQRKANMSWRPVCSNKLLSFSF
jgi:hypothetical protein